MLAGRHVRSAMQNLPAGPGVEFHENVADIAPYFHALDIFLYAPPHGSGMKVKILEALGFGSPIVTTPAGSEGIPLADGVHASVADTDEELAQRAIALLENPAQARQQTRAGRRLLESYCDPQRSVQRFADLYESL
jgi:glycosyltransferase involved in cell wall biosynthesis